MLGNFSKTILLEISLFLPPFNVFQVLSTINKLIFYKINSTDFKIIYLKCFLGISFPLSLPLLLKILQTFKANEILNFEAWKTNGEECYSNILHNSHSMMWTYSPISYTTNCDIHSNKPFIKNICCLAYFSGTIQEKRFSTYYHCGLDALMNDYEFIPEGFKGWDKCDREKLLVLDPIGNKRNQYKNLTEYRPLYPFFRDGKISSQPQHSPNTPIIKKIAVAREILSFGLVKSMLFLFSKSICEINYEEFDIFNDIEDYEAAKNIGVIVQHIDNDEGEFIEFEESDKKFYPAAWVCFKVWNANHFLFELKKCHFAKLVCVNL
jgi:hypothetical protein